MNDTLLATLTLALPIATALLVWRALPGWTKWIALLPAAVTVLHGLFIAAEFSCEGGYDEPWRACTLPAEGFFNSLHELLFANLTVLFVACPTLLIIAGIAWLVGREKHGT